MKQALDLRAENGLLKNWEKPVPSQRTVARIMTDNNLSPRRKRKPNGLTKADRLAQKSDDLIKRDFAAEKPLQKAVCDITEVKCADGKLYISALEDCYDNAVLALSLADDTKAELVVKTLESACKAYPGLRGAIVHSDRGSQYTSALYREAVARLGVRQSMNSAGGRCHDNAKAESLWARFKEELLYGRYRTETLAMDAVKTLVWRYFMSYWNNRRICSVNGGLPPMEKRRRFYQNQDVAA
jgi:transposase InsO family protein